jgi:PAS domain S-box-containing protein
MGVTSTETVSTLPDPFLPRMESRLREVLNLANVGTWEANFLICRDIWSQKVYEILGVNSDATPSFDLFRSLVHPDDREQVDASRARFHLAHMPFDLRLRIVRPDGQCRVIRCCGTAVKNTDDQPVGIVGLIQDITSQFEADRVLRESEARMRSLIGSIDEVVFEFDAAGLILNVWSRNDELLALPRDDLIGKNVEKLLGKEFFDPWRLVFERVLQTGTSENVEYPMTVRAGPRWFLAHVAPVASEDGSFRSVCLLARDITERKCIEQTLHHLSTRLLSIQDEERRRISHILHETTAQSLLAVKLNLQAVARSHSVSAALRGIHRESLELIEGAMQEIRTLSYVLHPPMLDEAGIASALRWYVKGFSERSGISVTLDAPDDFGRFPREIEMMMFRVAAESLSNIHRHSGSSKAAIRLIRAPDEFVIEIEDWGRGISAERLRAAETGALGVGIVGMRERVAEIHGKLIISSRPGGGSVVRLVLPVTAQTSAARA